MKIAGAASLSTDDAVQITVSIVSHNHGSMLTPLVNTLLNYPEISTIIVTHNVAEDTVLPEDAKILQRWNETPMGFGENHNHAFGFCSDPFFCVLNPDIEFFTNPYPALIKELIGSQSAMIAPKVVNAYGQTEDSARHFPTISGLFKKLLGFSDGRHMELSSKSIFHPECVAGMFMLFRKASFEALDGFDTRYYLYYEDIDVCARIWKTGGSISLLPTAVVTHNAQRQSHKSFRFLKWHLCSMLLFFYLHMGRLPRVPSEN